MADADGRGDHWDATYRRTAPIQLSWYQSEPTVSLDLIEALDSPRDGAVIDVGGGASTLIDRLLARGFLDFLVDAEDRQRYLDTLTAAVFASGHVTPAGTRQPFTWVAARALH